MGNRENLLAGAKRCLYEKGYASTTARDIATASGTSLAAIGYHFGSKEALMNQARLQAFGDWTDQLTRALETELDPATPAIERFEAIWTKVIELFEANRPMWLASFEILAQIDRDPQVRSAVAKLSKEHAWAWRCCSTASIRRSTASRRMPSDPSTSLCCQGSWHSG